MRKDLLDFAEFLGVVMAITIGLALIWVGVANENGCRVYREQVAQGRWILTTECPP